MSKKLFPLVIVAVLSVMPGLVSHAAGGGGGGVVAGPANFGLVYGIQGKVDLRSPREEPVRLNEKNDILRIVKNGDKLRTNEDGKLIIVSLSEKMGYELMPNTLVRIVFNELSTVRGTVNRIEGLYFPKSLPARLGNGIMVANTPREKSCIRIVSPQDTSIITATPTLKWENDCKGNKKVTVKLISNQRIVYQAITGDTYMKIPKDVLDFEQTCTWLVDGGKNGIVGGVFSILSEFDVKEALDMKFHYTRHEGDMHERVSYIFYLKHMNLSAMANAEVIRMKKDFPENTNIKVR